MKITLEALRSRFLGLCSDLGLDGGLEWQTLEKLHSEPHRAYHNLTHITDCLWQLDHYPDPIADRQSLELAIWFHDAVYDPRSGDNELKSADLVEAFLNGTPLATIVRSLILATRHDRTPDSPDAAVITDIDLSILGSSPDRYEKYSSAIQQEYAFVPADAYRQGRIMVLSRFIDRPSIYSTPFYRTELEASARANLAAEIDSLKSQDDL